MDTSLFHVAIVWAALALGLACLILRLIPRRPPGPEGPESLPD